LHASKPAGICAQRPRPPPSPPDSAGSKRCTACRRAWLKSCTNTTLPSQRPRLLVRMYAARPPAAFSLEGLAMMSEHLGMWRSATSSAKRLPQCGHCTRVSSTSSTCGTGPPQPAAPTACGRVDRIAARSCSLCCCHLDFLACAAEAAGRLS
jgi:hypothetical protein